MPKAKVKSKYPEIKEIKEDLESLKDNTVELAQHVKKDSVEQIEATTQTLKAYATQELAKAEKVVREKPVQSVAIAFAGGLLASALIKRGRR